MGAIYIEECFRMSGSTWIQRIRLRYGLLSIASCRGDEQVSWAATRSCSDWRLFLLRCPPSSCVRRSWEYIQYSITMLVNHQSFAATNTRPPLAPPRAPPPDDEQQEHEIPRAEQVFASSTYHDCFLCGIFVLRKYYYWYGEERE